MLAVGLMSGTSLDGTDAALVEITGVGPTTKVKLRRFASYPFASGLKTKIKAALAVETSDVEQICSLNFELGAIFGAAVVKICAEAKIAPQELTFVASHGQTVYHLPRPDRPGLVPSTLQIGDPALIAERAQTAVISNFREADMAVGGQGAPIVPYSEYILYRSPEQTRILQNIGGIGNATVIPAAGELSDVVAFDTGPGNMIIDELCRRFYHEEYDRDGAHGAAGQVNQTVLQKLLQHPYFARPFPKTSGREDFGSEYVDQIMQQFDLGADDWVATATALTAQSIAQAVKQFATAQTELIIGGGGSYNPTLVKMIQAALPKVKVGIQEDYGYSSDAKEAIAMVVLGNQTWHHQPSNVPSATGAKRPVILGRITYF
ncbi:anhydro-N-acetylmuramic acid kinase AnmK [Lapidilactobacillus gannanensis]|uniref:Anhydro-N-acetylmuramic acid kinase n=1 Tax=Lapidilactobacillus gannanensis TaxID=2486002 RepID=A0ABW4BNI7_9LACO|nr:anhydro-N-acetylmuramic acid kinase AnmK [Lapidilactobacillus gannanensis]